MAKITLERGITVLGKVTDEAGKPIAGAVIRTKFLNDIREAKTDKVGTYQLAGCEPAMARIVVSAKGRATDMQEVRCAADMGPVNFAMKPGGKIRIRRAGRKRQAGRQRPHLLPTMRRRYAYLNSTTSTNTQTARGVAVERGPGGRISCGYLSAGDMQMPNQRLIARDKEYVFRTHPMLVISGSVIDSETKKPVKSFRVVPGIRGYRYPAIPMTGTQTHIDWVRGESYLAKDGHTAVQCDREELAHLVRIEADGYRVAVSRDVKSDKGKVQVDFALIKAKEIAATL